MTKLESGSAQGFSASASARAAGESPAGSGRESLDDEQQQYASKQAPPSLLKALFAKSRETRQSPRQETLVHDGNNASIILDEEVQRETPWTPKSLGRAKTAIIYKVGPPRFRRERSRAQPLCGQ